MLSKKMQDAINKQINREFFSGYLYLSMAAYFESKNLPGFANWMHNQAKEEISHGMKFYSYIYDQLGSVKLLPIEQPQTEWKSPLSAFEDVCKHEKHVTDLIHKLMKLAIDENDQASISFLRWFVDEQVEEEANADLIVEQIKMAGEDNIGLLLMDKELAKRGAK